MSNVYRAGAEAMGINAEDPKLDLSDVPFARKVMGTASPWQARDITYQRIAEVELLADEAKGTDDRAKQARRENRRLLALTDDARKTRKGMSNLRKERRRILEDDAIPTPEQRRRTDRIDQRVLGLHAGQHGLDDPHADGAHARSPAITRQHPGFAIKRNHLRPLRRDHRDEFQHHDRLDGREV